MMIIRIYRSLPKSHGPQVLKLGLILQCVQLLEMKLIDESKQYIDVRPVNNTARYSYENWFKCWSDWILNHNPLGRNLTRAACPMDGSLSPQCRMTREHAWSSKFPTKYQSISRGSYIKAPYHETNPPLQLMEYKMLSVGTFSNCEIRWLSSTSAPERHVGFDLRLLTPLHGREATHTHLSILEPYIHLNPCLHSISAPH